MLRIISTFCLLMFSVYYLKAAEFSSDKIIQLELINGTVLIGRVIDSDAHQLQIVGYQLNRLVPFSNLSEASRKEFNLLEPMVNNSDTHATFAGLNSTRDNLRTKSNEILSYQVPLLYPTFSYAIYPHFYQPTYFYYHSPQPFCLSSHSSLSFQSSSFFFNLRF